MPVSPAVALTKRYVAEWRAAFRPAALNSQLEVRELGLNSRVKIDIKRPADSLDAHLLNRAHCFPDFEGDPQRGNYTAYFPNAMRAQADTSIRIFRNSMAAYCPYWSATSAQFGVTGVQSIERTLHAGYRPTFTSARGRFVLTLDSLVARTPTDSVARGQLVRFALELGDTLKAARAAAGCAEESAQCLALRGLVALHEGSAARAQSLFTQARAVRRVAGECGDSTFSTLVRFSLTAVSTCRQRIEQEERFWWLAAPLWDQDVNSRRLEHERRLVDFALRQQGGADEILDVTVPNVREARALVLRYGWPSALRVLSSGADKSQDIFVPSARDVPLRPYGAPLYSRDRYPTIPDSLAFADPTASIPSDWVVGDPAPLHPMWGAWPYEHARMLPFIAPITTAQFGRFAGVDGVVRLVAATPWPEPSAPPIGKLIWSSHPDTMRTVATARADIDQVLRLLGSTPLTPGVLSLEVRAGGADSTMRAWRLRMGARVTPDLLSAITTGRGLSDLLLVEGSEGLFNRPVTLEAMANLMLPSTSLERTRSRVGIFWELYGVAPEDTVHYILALTSTQPAPLLTRVFAGLTGRTTERAANAVEIRWERALTAALLRRDSAIHTTFPDGLVLTMPALPPGAYQLELRASTTSTGPIYRALRAFSVR